MFWQWSSRHQEEGPEGIIDPPEAVAQKLKTSLQPAPPSLPNRSSLIVLYLRLYLRFVFVYTLRVVVQIKPKYQKYLGSSRVPKLSPVDPTQT